MMKEIEKGSDGWVVMMQLAFQHIFGDVRGERRVGTEQAEKIDGDAGDGIRSAGPHRVEAGRGKAQGRVLPETHRIFAGGNGKTDARQIGPLTLEQPDAAAEELQR